MIELTVADVSTDSAPVVDPGTPAAEAARSLHDPAVPALVVREEDDVVGVVTDSDFVTLVAEGRDGCTVEEVMSSPAVTVPPTASITAAADRMREAGVGCLPVVEDDAYRGLVSTATLSPYLPPHRLEIDRRRRPLRPASTERARADERRPSLEATPSP